MRCIDDETYLRYENGLFSKENENRIKDHLKSCTSCIGLLRSERQFEKDLRSVLKRDYRVRDFASTVLAPFYGSRTSLKRALIVAGSLLWAVAIFNSILLGYFLLRLNDFSIARIIVGFKDMILSIGTLFSAYSIYIEAMSATLYMFAAFILFISMFFGVLFKPQEN